MTAEGTILNINGDEYIVERDYQELLVLRKGDYFSIYFPTRNILIPCGTKKCSRKIKDGGTKVTFGGIVFPVRGYETPTLQTKNIFVSLTVGDFVFRTTKNGDLLTVCMK